MRDQTYSTSDVSEVRYIRGPLALLRYTLLATSVASIAVVAPASAQNAPVESATSSQASTGDIIVTAQKKSERLLDVPVPVTALDTSQLTARNQVSIRDYFAQVPGLSLNAEGSGQTVIVIRGIVTADLSNPTVGISIDDVPFGSSTALGYGSFIAPDIDPADLAQIEVLKGPQGTLYGASSLGGIVKYVTADPSTAKFSGRIATDFDGTIGGGLGYGVRAGANIPLTSDLALRVSGFSRRTPGYVDNIVNGKSDVNSVDVQGGHASLLWTPAPAFSVKLSALVQHTKGNGFDGVGTTYDQKPLYGDLQQSQPPGSGTYKSTLQLYSLNLHYHSNAVEVASVTGYGINKYLAHPSLPAYDGLASLVTPIADPAAVLVDGFTTRKFTQEVRLSAPTGSRLEWLAGAFYDHEDTPGGQSVLAVDGATGKQQAVIGSFQFPSKFEEGAVFGNLNFHVTDRFDIQGGVRYSRNHQIYNERDDLNPAIDPEPSFYHTTLTDSSTTFQVTPSFKISPNALLYARVASGYRPGGVNAAIPAGSSTPRTYNADTTVNYEIGAKGSAFDRKFTYDLSIYDIEWKNIQIQLTDPVSDFVYFLNAERARSKGAEFALQYAPVHGTRLGINGSYNDAKLTKAIPAGGAVGPAGSRLPFSAKVQGSATIDQDFVLPGDWLGTIGGTVSYVGSRLQGFANDPGELRTRSPAYASLDLRLSATKGPWTASLFGKNVTNKRGVLSTLSEFSPVATTSSVYDTVYIQPTTVGISLQRNF